MEIFLILRTNIPWNVSQIFSQMSQYMHVFAWCVDLILNCIHTVNCHHWGLSFSVFSHPTSCCSAAEIMSVLFFHTMRYKTEYPRNQCNDRFVLSKVKVNTQILGLNYSISLPEISPDCCFFLLV